MNKFDEEHYTVNLNYKSTTWEITDLNANLTLQPYFFVRNFLFV